MNIASRSLLVLLTLQAVAGVPSQDSSIIEPPNAEGMAKAGPIVLLSLAACAILLLIFLLLLCCINLFCEPKERLIATIPHEPVVHLPVPHATPLAPQLPTAATSTIQLPKPDMHDSTTQVTMYDHEIPSMYGHPHNKYGEMTQEQLARLIAQKTSGTSL